MSAQTTFWDPFEARIQPATETQLERTKPLLPASFKKLEVPFFLLSLPGFLLAIFSESLRPLGFVLVTIGMGGGFAIDHFTGASKDRLNRLRSAAQHLGFRFRSKIPDVRMQKIRQQIPEIFKLRVGGSIPLVIESEMWGTAENGSPLWVGLGAHSSTALFGGPKQNTKSAGSGPQGNVVMMVAAYKLDRDARIRLVLMPENLSSVGPLDRDLKTESIAFNDAFNIRVTARDDEGQLDKVSVEVLQVLTPALQTTLLDLADRFAARVIIDRDTVFFAGFRNLQGLDDTILQSFVKDAVAGFSEAAVSFKHYAE
ncbi:hypothetical protein ABVF61_11355 [Roseibium sp. HPY-6]|uniref:hypothetical protein n=1 Tax=Roseibium sp. HPY-6 TaxID=3229852 RepID=UPI00338DA676